MKKFQIIIESGDNGPTIIDTTDESAEVDEWLADFEKAGIVGQTFKVFEMCADVEHAYVLVCKRTKERPCDVRPVGFGRW